MAHTTTTAPNLETLTEVELFRRYLGAVIRVGATTSALVPDHGTMFDTTARDWFLQYGATNLMPNDYAEDLLAQIEEDECPLFELETIIEDFSGLLEALKFLRIDFARLVSATRVAQPEETGDEDADSAAYDEWNANPRYVLPVVEQSEAA